MKLTMLAALAWLAACARQVPVPPPTVPSPITVFPAHNRTGLSLLIAGPSLLERYVLHTERVTVEDVLADEAARQLARRGFAVTPPDAVETATGGRPPGSPSAAVDVARAAGLAGSVLYLEIQQWEVDGATHPAYVIVGIQAVLLDVQTGNRLWETRRAPAPIATPGAVTLGTAYTTAAEKTVDEILAGWPSHP